MKNSTFQLSNNYKSDCEYLKRALLEVKRLKKVEHFYLSQSITLHPQNSIFFYLRIYLE